MVASNQLAELNEKLAVQKVAVTEKSEACERLLAEISENTGKAIEKKQMAEAKKEEIAEQNKLIVVEKVSGGEGYWRRFMLKRQRGRGYWRSFMLER